METKIEENLIHETTQSIDKSREGFEMSAEQASQITTELSKLNDAILHDKPISIDDLEDLSKVARGTKIDVGGEVMTVEEAEQIPDLKMNVEIWNEMREGRFENTGKLTKITPKVSKYLEYIYKDIDLSGLTSAKGLVLPKIIKGGLALSGLTSSEDLVLPEIIGDLYLNRLTSMKGLVLPKTILGGLYLSNLTSVDGLVLPQTIEGDLSLGLTSASGLQLPKHIGGYLSLINLTTAKDLVLSNYIGRDLYLNSLTSSEGLVLPEIIEGGILLNGLTSAQKAELRKQFPLHATKIM